MAESPNEFFIEALGHVFVSMASMPLHQTDAGNMPELKGEALNIQIEFSGKHAGELFLVVEDSLASRIAARILGMENGLSVEMIEDAARELINVVCGHFITLMYGYTAIVRVSIPKVLRIGSTAFNLMLNSPDVCTFMVEESPILGRINLK